MKWHIVLVFSLLIVVQAVSQSVSGPVSVVDTLDITGITTGGFGLTYDWSTDCLWVGDLDAGILYRITKTNPPTIQQIVLVLVGPSDVYGLTYDGSTVMLCGNDKKIYTMDLVTGIASLYRNVPGYWIGDQPLALDVVNDAIYSGDWEVDDLAYASPAQTGGWHTWGMTDISGLACSFSGSEPAQYLFAVSQHPSQGYLIIYILDGGIPQFPAYGIEPLPEELSQINVADCAYDGVYLYVLDNQGSASYIFVLDWLDNVVQSQSLGEIRALFK